MDVLGVEDVAELLFGEAVELGVVGIELGADAGAAVLVPLERREGNAAPLTPTLSRRGRGS